MTPKSLRAHASLLLAAALALTACAETGSGGDQSGGTGLPATATKAEFQQALSGMDPVNLNVQTLGSKGSADDAKDEEYMAAVTDWSGGKITFTVNYAQAVATGPAIDEAVATGLLDMATVIPSYNPKLYPTFTELNNVSGVLSDDPVASMLQAQAWWLAVPASLPSFGEEFQKQGLEVLVAGYASAPHSIQCTKPRRTAGDFKGAVVRSSEAKVKAQVATVGADAANISTAESFEALQRGVVDCEVTSMRVSAKSGTLEEAHYVTTAPIGYNAATLVMNKDVWGRLPLAARQLFHDRLDVYLNANIRSGWKANGEALDIVRKAGGSIEPASDEVITKFTGVNESLLGQADPDVAKAAREKAGVWSAKAKELGFPATDWSEFAAWLATNPDPQPFVDAMTREILAADRPA